MVADEVLVKGPLHVQAHLSGQGAVSSSVGYQLSVSTMMGLSLCFSVADVVGAG